MIRAAALLVAALCLADAAGAADPDPYADPALAAASAAVARAGTALEAARGGGADRLTVLAPAVEGYQAALAGLRAAVTAATAHEQDLTLALVARQAETERLLGTLAAATRTLPGAGGLHPEGPVAAAEAASMVARIEPALRDRARALAGEVAAITAAQAVADRGTAELDAGLATLAAAQEELDATMASLAMSADQPIDPDLVALARDSESLTALAAALAKLQAAPADPVPVPPLMWPLAGDVVRGYGEPDAAGARRPGIVLRAPPLTLVRAPADATVRYAGPFLEYGAVLVLEPAPGTMVVLAGLSRTRVHAGMTVRRGEPLGLLGGRPLGVEEYVMLPAAETGAGGGETLYIEVRHGQGPVDPQPLFSAQG